MPTLTINGIQVTVEPGTSLIEAAKKAGVEVPHYCYHPGLTVAGNCRMCLVEIEKMPKLQIACGTPVAEGMVVHTESEKVKKARQGVQEFLFVNHPLDCPVCDQAGECKLQDYYMLYDLQPSRMYDRKTRRVKAQPLGPYVIYDAERCIACSRCVRFTDEISKTSELGIFERGDHYYVGLAAGTELNNPYSIMTAEICPVGALTNRDFRFKMRVWYLTDHKSVCSGCARGCAIKLSENGGVIYRTLARENLLVNKWWACDDGHFVFKREIGPNRLRDPQVRRGPSVESLDWDTALDLFYARVRQIQKEFGPHAIAGLSSNQGSNEEIHLFSRLMREALGAGSVAGKSDIGPEGYQVVEDDILIKADKNPNTYGLRAFGGLATDATPVREAVAAGNVKMLIVWGRGLDRAWGGQTPELLAKVDFVVYVGAHEPAHRADLVLPGSAWAEKEGTFTNFEGVVQHFESAVPPPGRAHADWQIFAELLRRFGLPAPTSVEAAFTEAAAQLPGLGPVTYARLGDTGVKIGETAALAARG